MDYRPKPAYLGDAWGARNVSTDHFQAFPTNNEGHAADSRPLTEIVREIYQHVSRRSSPAY